MLRRIERDAAIICALMALAAWWWRPDTPRLAWGVVGGGVLMALSYWALRGSVEGLLRAESDGRRGGGRALVKFFTRQGILALAAYGMMVRLRLDPLGLLLGVTSLVLATTVEAFRGVQARQSGGPGK